MEVVHSYRDLIVWQKAMEMVVEIYRLTDKLPREEIYGLTSQMRRSAVSVPSNIAEGRFRGSRKDFSQFLRIAYGSGGELETQIEICKRVFKIQSEASEKAEGLLLEVMKILNVMIKNLKAESPKS